jgi:protein phosphatase
MAVVKSAGITDIGRRRKGNEDSYLLDNKLGLYIVSDGMGGRQAGEVASRLVTETMESKIKEFLDQDTSNDLENVDSSLSREGNFLISSIKLANALVCETAQIDDAYKGMGATVAAVLIAQDILIAANVGDSPIYLIRNGAIEDLYVPHTVMAEHEALAPKGSKKLGEQFKHMITRAMGISDTVEPDIFEIQCFEKDTVVICSDGLSDKVSSSEILSMVEIAEPDKACSALVNLANERGGEDNITVIVAKIETIGAEGETEVVEEIAEQESFALENPLAVEYDTEDASYKGAIQSINTKELFIETLEAFDIGQELMLTISDQNNQHELMLNGKIVDRNPEGIRVAFEKPDADQKEMIKKLIAETNKS